MKRYLDEETVNIFIEEKLNSRTDFCKELKISYSHFLKMMRRESSVGNVTLKKIKLLADKYNSDLEDFLEPLPIKLGDKSLKEIIITDLENNLVASINSRNEITNENYKVEYIQF